MKVALVHEYLNQWGGAERVVDALHELFPHAPLYTLMYDPERMKGHFRGLDIRTSFLQRQGIARFRKYTFPLGPLAIESFDFSDFDVVISSSSSYAKGIITRPEILHICYCHTPTSYLWGWTHHYLKEQRLGRFTGAVVRSILHQQRQWDRLAAERVDRWVANSKNVQQRITKYYRKESTIIYPPVDIERFSLAPKIEDYFLFVGRLSAYKRADLAVQACRQLGLKLLVIGEGDERPHLESIAGKTVEFLGWQRDTETASYMSRCQALIFPGEEDFGITPVEAMAAGRPVIALAKGGALETVVEGKTGLLFGAPSVEALVHALRTFEQQAHRFEPKKIRRHAEQFDQSVFVSRMKRFVEGSWQDFVRKRPARKS